MAKRRAILSDEETDGCVEKWDEGDESEENKRDSHGQHFNLDPCLMSTNWAEMTEMTELLNHPLPTALLNNHPNALPDLSFTDNNWIQLVRAYNSEQSPSDLPLILAIRRLQLDRTPIHIRSFHCLVLILVLTLLPQLINSLFHHNKACPQKRLMKFPVWLHTFSTSSQSITYVLPILES